MSFQALVQGQVVKAPREGTGASGKRWVQVGVRCKIDAPRGGEADSLIAQIIGFGDVADQLCDLTVGDPLSVCGSAKVNVFERDGTSHGGLGIIAEKVVALESKPKVTRRYNRRAFKPDFKKASANDFEDDEISF